MATRFEIVLHGAEEPRLIAAAEAALTRSSAPNAARLYRRTASLPDQRPCLRRPRARGAGLFPCFSVPDPWEQKEERLMSPLPAALGLGFYGGSGMRRSKQLEEAREPPLRACPVDEDSLPFASTARE